MLIEEMKAPKIIGTVEERLEDLEQKIFRYNTVVERSLDAHHFMNLELEKKVEEYKERLEDLEKRYLHVTSELDKHQALLWDVENQNCEYEERFKKIAAAATLRYNDPPNSFYNGRPSHGRGLNGRKNMRKKRLQQRKHWQNVKLGGVPPSLYLY